MDGETRLCKKLELPVSVNIAKSVKMVVISMKFESGGEGGGLKST
jgi:hypothetical protein